MAETTPFTLDPELTGVTKAYQNPAHTYIAPQVLPRVNVNVKKFDHEIIEDGKYLTVPNNKMGRASTAPEVNIGSTRLTASCEDYGLEDAIPLDDINQAQNAVQAQSNPLMKATTWLTSLQMIAVENALLILCKKSQIMAQTCPKYYQATANGIMMHLTQLQLC